MEKIEKIVELGIDIDDQNEELFEDLGVDVISFVESPAIEESFLYFNAEGEPTCDCGTHHEFVDVRSGESEEEYIGRCMSSLEGEFPDQDQRLAVCYATWEEQGMSYEETVDAMLKFAEDNGELLQQGDVVVDLSKEEFTTAAEVIEGLGALDLLTRLNIKRDEPAQTYFRYVGPPAERKFCKAMLRLANRGKIFTREEIEAMSGLNPQFARRGQSSYDIFKWLGGKNCRHRFQKLEVFKNAEGKRVVIVADPSNNAERLASKPWAEKMSSEYSFKIENEDKRIVYSPVMIPNKMILRRDEQGNPFYVYFSRETIKKMAEKFLAQNKLHNTDVEHDGNVKTTNMLLESWVSEDMTHDKSYKLGFMLPAGTWYVGYRIHDDELWADIKEGRVRGVSLAGNFINRL